MLAMIWQSWPCIILAESDFISLFWIVLYSRVWGEIYLSISQSQKSVNLASGSLVWKFPSEGGPAFGSRGLAEVGASPPGRRGRRASTPRTLCWHLFFQPGAPRVSPLSIKTLRPAPEIYSKPFLMPRVQIRKIQGRKRCIFPDPHWLKIKRIGNNMCSSTNLSPWLRPLCHNSQGYSCS